MPIDKQISCKHTYRQSAATTPLPHRRPTPSPNGPPPCWRRSWLPAVMLRLRIRSRQRSIKPASPAKPDSCRAHSRAANTGWLLRHVTLQSACVRGPKPRRMSGNLPLPVCRWFCACGEGGRGVRVAHGRGHHAPHHLSIYVQAEHRHVCAAGLQQQGRPLSPGQTNKRNEQDILAQAQKNKRGSCCSIRIDNISTEYVTVPHPDYNQAARADAKVRIVRRLPGCCVRPVGLVGGDAGGPPVRWALHSAQPCGGGEPSLRSTTTRTGAHLARAINKIIDI
jgi:hypothetical protein